MMRPELLLVLLLATGKAQAAALDTAFLTFLANEAAAAQTVNGGSAPANDDMLVWLQNGWTPATSTTATQTKVVSRQENTAPPPAQEDAP